LVAKGSATHKIWSELTLTQTFNFVHWPWTQQFNIFTGHFFAYDGLPSSWVWLQKSRWRYSRNRYILITQAHTVTLTLKIESHFFRITFRLMVVHHNAKFGYKRLHTSTQPTGNKCVSQAVHPSPLRTLLYFHFCSQIIHNTQRKKRSNIAAASQLMWTRTLG